MRRCRSLRWKGFYADPTPDEVTLDFLKNEVPYTCLRTCQPWGPDDDVVAPEACDEARGCFRALGAPPVT